VDVETRRKLFVAELPLGALRAEHVQLA